LELLARLFSELKLLEIKIKDRMQYSSEYENLYNRALNVYHGIFKYPEAYPKRDAGWFRDFVEHYAGNAEERE
jgi:hypothetical protein